MQPLVRCHDKPYLGGVAGAALLVIGCIPVALSNSEGVGSGQALVWLLPVPTCIHRSSGMREPNGCVRARHTFPSARVVRPRKGPPQGPVIHIPNMSGAPLSPLAETAVAQCPRGRERSRIRGASHAAATRHG